LTDRLGRSCRHVGATVKTPGSRIELELTRAVLEGEALRRQTIGLALVAVIGGAAGAARLATGVDDHALAHVLVGASPSSASLRWHSSLCDAPAGSSPR